MRKGRIIENNYYLPRFFKNNSKKIPTNLYQIRTKKVSQIVSGNLIKKHKYQKTIQPIISPYLQRKYAINNKLQEPKEQNLKKLIKIFFNKDENSSPSPKKDTIKRFGIKVQKRYMSDTISSLYKSKFQNHIFTN